MSPKTVAGEVDPSVTVESCALAAAPIAYSDSPTSVGDDVLARAPNWRGRLAGVLTLVRPAVLVLALAAAFVASILIVARPVHDNRVDAAPVTAPLPPAPPPAVASAPPPAAQAPTSVPAPPHGDAVYLRDLASRDIGYTSRDGVIGLGHEVCTALSEGLTYPQELRKLMRYLTFHAASGTLEAAVDGYCPQYSVLLP